MTVEWDEYPIHPQQHLGHSTKYKQQAGRRWCFCGNGHGNASPPPAVRAGLPPLRGPTAGGALPRGPLPRCAGRCVGRAAPSGEYWCNKASKRWILLIFRETRGGWGQFILSAQLDHSTNVCVKSDSNRPTRCAKLALTDRQTEIRGQTDAWTGNKSLPSLACGQQPLPQNQQLVTPTVIQ